MVPRQIQELRNALCPRCGLANDVAVTKCHQCGETLHASAHQRTEASNDSVPDAMFDEAVDGSPLDSSLHAPAMISEDPSASPSEDPIASPEDPLASPPDAPQGVQVPAGFTISFEPDPGAPNRDRYTVKIARSTAEPVTAATLVAADSAHAAFESFTAELRAQFDPNGASSWASPTPDRFSRVAMLDAIRASMSSRGAMVAGAMFVAGLAAVAYLMLQQRPAVDLSRLVIPGGTSQAVDAGIARDPPSAPVRLTPVEAAVTTAAPALNRAESSSPADAGLRPTPLPVPETASKRADPAAAAPRPARTVKPPPAPSLANAPVQPSLQRDAAVVPPKPAGASTQAPPSRFGPCTAGVAALGLCTLESASGGN
jgi:hypothetical protein